jgi:dipeptidyl-peptidase-4
MGLPSENKAGYDRSSVIKAAANLHGKLLLLQGTLDDNVHPQNTIEFIDAIQKADLPTPPFILLPGSDHSPRALQHQWAVLQAKWAFLKRNL